MADPDPNAQAPEVRPEIARLLRERDRLATMRYAANTVEGYRYAWSIFERWCRRMAPPLASMSGETLRKIVKAAVSSLGIDATDYAGHSLRASLITAAGERNISPLVIAEHTGHRSLDTLKLYFRRTRIWQANPTGMVGL